MLFRHQHARPRAPHRHLQIPPGPEQLDGARVRHGTIENHECVSPEARDVRVQVAAVAELQNNDHAVGGGVGEAAVAAHDVRMLRIVIRNVINHACDQNGSPACKWRACSLLRMRYSLSVSGCSEERMSLSTHALRVSLCRALYLRGGITNESCDVWR